MVERGVPVGLAAETGVPVNECGSRTVLERVRSVYRVVKAHRKQREITKKKGEIGSKERTG